MDFKTIFLLITSGVNIGLAFFIFGKDWKKSMNISFAAMLISISIWSLSLALFYQANDVEGLHKLIPPIYISAALIAVSFNYFCYSFPFWRRKKSLLFNLIAGFVTFILVMLILYFRIESEITFDRSLGHPTKVNLSIYSLYSGFFLYFILSSFIELGKKIKLSSGYTRRLIVIIFLSTLIAAIFGTLFNLIIPIATYKYVWVGPLFTLIMVSILVKYIFLAGSKNED